MKITDSQLPGQASSEVTIDMQAYRRGKLTSYLSSQKGVGARVSEIHTAIKLAMSSPPVPRRVVPALPRIQESVTRSRPRLAYGRARGIESQKRSRWGKRAQRATALEEEAGTESKYRNIIVRSTEVLSQMDRYRL